MSELNMDDDRAAALWNAQADQHNQWSELDADEKAAWIAKCAAPVGEVELPALPEPAWVYIDSARDNAKVDCYTAEQVRQAQVDAIAPYAERIRQLEAAYDAATSLAGDTIDARNAEVAQQAERIRVLERELAERKTAQAGWCGWIGSVGDYAQFHVFLTAVCDAAKELDDSTDGGAATFAAADKLTAAQDALVAYIDGRTAGAVWISVDDACKPEPKKPVLLFVRTLTRREDDDGRPYDMEGAEVAMGEYRKGSSDEMSYFDCYSSPMSDNDWITHWMPMPAGPIATKETA